MTSSAASLPKLLTLDEYRARFGGGSGLELLDLGKARPVLDDPILGPDKFIRPHPAQHRPRHCQPWGQRDSPLRDWGSDYLAA